MVFERRQYKRSDLKYFAHVYNRKLNRLIGYLVNITPNGMMVVTDKPIDPDAIVELYVEFTESKVSPLRIDLNARCVWSKVDPDSGYCELGFRLCDIQDDQAKSIEQIIKRFGF